MATDTSQTTTGSVIYEGVTSELCSIWENLFYRLIIRLSSIIELLFALELKSQVVMFIELLMNLIALAYPEQHFDGAVWEYLWFLLICRTNIKGPVDLTFFSKLGDLILPSVIFFKINLIHFLPAVLNVYSIILLVSICDKTELFSGSSSTLLSYK